MRFYDSLNHQACSTHMHNFSASGQPQVCSSWPRQRTPAVVVVLMAPPGCIWHVVLFRL